MQVLRQAALIVILLMGIAGCVAVDPVYSIWLRNETGEPYIVTFVEPETGLTASYRMDPGRQGWALRGGGNFREVQFMLRTLSCDVVDTAVVRVNLAGVVISSEGRLDVLPDASLESGDVLRRGRACGGQLDEF